MSRSIQRSKPTLRKQLLRALKICATVYLLVGVGCAGFQRRMIYFPPKFTPQQTDELARSAKLERWQNPSGDFIGMKRLSPQPPALGRVLVVYGNGSCAVDCAHYADVIQATSAFDVFILEYPGYADRQGSPSQNSFFRAADEAFQLIPTNAPIYVLGESLGTGVACFLAGTHPDMIAGLVLLAPYNRLADVAQYHMPFLPVHLMLVDRFPSQDYLRNYHGPVGVLVAGKDQVVPEKFGRRLYDNYSNSKRLWEFPEGNHGTVMVQPAKVWKQILDFWQAHRQR
jgi:pimeloyl-ACP methyl ester carboxylesterase